MEKERECITCGVRHSFILRGGRGTYSSPRCHPCSNAYRATQKLARDVKKREERALRDEDVAANRKICTACKKLKHLTEFRKTAPNSTKLSKLCDRCLCEASDRRLEAGSYGALRRGAYLLNSVHRRQIARMRGVRPEELTTADLEWCCKPDDIADIMAPGICRYCHIQVELELNASFDHAYPLTRGGEMLKSNIILSCRDCNQLKGTRDAPTFLEFVREYAARILATTPIEPAEPTDNWLWG